MNTKEQFEIEGLAGEKTLKGTVSINGAKNAALPAMAAAVLFDGAVQLHNIPNTDDVHTMSEILRKLGAEVSWVKDGGLKEQIMVIDPGTIHSTDIDEDLAKGMRASVFLTGPLLARFGKATFPVPGGCVIGARPIDLFLEGYAKMGAQYTETNCMYSISVDSSKKKILPANIFFNKISVGATETLLMASVLAEGKTILKNCAMEPEIVNVAEWLNACGADIKGAGTPTIEITGTGGKLLSATAATAHTYVTIPDRIEAGSFLLLGALSAKELTIKDCEPAHLEAVLGVLEYCGVEFEVRKNEIKISGNAKPNTSFKSLSDLRTHEYPGFPTDLQAQLVTFLTQVSGESTVVETIFEGRFKYVEELTSMGANITIMNPREILIKGPASLRQLLDDEELTAHDIRAGFAVVMAALTGTGKFRVNNVHLIDRGYERLEERLADLGAKIKRVVI